MRAAMEPGVHTMSDELILQISCNIFLAFKWMLMMTSGQNISHYTTAKLSVHVWNHDLIGWQNKIDTQKHFHKTTTMSSWTLSKTKIPITIVKAQMPSNPNQKSHMQDNKMSYHEISQSQRREIERFFKCSNRFEICQAHQQHCKFQSDQTILDMWISWFRDFARSYNKMSWYWQGPGSQLAEVNPMHRMGHRQSTLIISPRRSDSP